MARSLTKQEQPTPDAETVQGTPAAGGPIAAIHRAIEERMMTADMGTALVFDIPGEDRLVRLVSRAAGPALLVVAYVSVASWWI